MKKFRQFTAAILGTILAGTSLLGTAAKIPAKAYVPLYLAGDVNLDGTTDLLDVVRMQRFLGGSLPALIQFEGEWWDEPNEREIQIVTDLNGDGDVDIFDLSLLKRLVLYGSFRENPVPTYTAKNLAAAYTPSLTASAEVSEDVLLRQTKFAIDLLKQNAETGENVLVSPFSVSQALGMTANGAKGDTLSEMENVLGAPINELNAALYAERIGSQVNTPNAGVFDSENSIWVRDGYPVREDFLRTNADYYEADAFSAPFDETTVEDINHWVSYHTDRMIPSILKELSENSMMCLVNTVRFDGYWEDPYNEYAIGDAEFTAADGTKQTAKMMYAPLEGYISDDHAEGFKKYYRGGNFYFAALLPEEGMTPEAYLADLTPERLRSALTESKSDYILSGLPEFSYDFSAELSDSLKDMGMPAAFDSIHADFSGMTDTPNDLYIDGVIHKTHIEVNPAGTRAAAATAVVLVEKAMDPSHQIILNRPFVYMIVDAKTDLPVFIGTVHSVE